MSGRTGIKRAVIRRVAGAMAVLWLNLTILPCAMALESTQDCPHQAQTNQGMPAHHGEHESMLNPDCATMSPKCCELDDVSTDSRTGKLDTKDTAEATALPVFESCQTEDDTAHLILHERGPPEPGGNPPPLRILYCVYLD